MSIVVENSVVSAKILNQVGQSMHPTKHLANRISRSPLSLIRSLKMTSGRVHLVVFLIAERQVCNMQIYMPCVEHANVVC